MSEHNREIVTALELIADNESEILSRIAELSEEIKRQPSDCTMVTTESQDSITTETRETLNNIEDDISDIAEKVSEMRLRNMDIQSRVLEVPIKINETNVKVNEVIIKQTETNNRLEVSAQNSIDHFNGIMSRINIQERRLNDVSSALNMVNERIIALTDLVIRQENAMQQQLKHMEKTIMAMRSSYQMINYDLIN